MIYQNRKKCRIWLENFDFEIHKTYFANAITTFYSVDLTASGAGQVSNRLAQAA